MFEPLNGQKARKLMLLSAALVLIHVFFFYKTVVYNKVALDCSEGSESSILDFRELRKLIISYTFKFNFHASPSFLGLLRTYFLW